MFSLLLAVICLAGAIYYRNRWKTCEKQKENLKKNQPLWQDWGE
jgi:hypothetical protein